MNDELPAGRALDASIAAALAIPAAEQRAICLVDGHECEGGVWCRTCHGLIYNQPHVPERYSTDIAASEQLNPLIPARMVAPW